MGAAEVKLSLSITRFKSESSENKNATFTQWGKIFPMQSSDRTLYPHSSQWPKLGSKNKFVLKVKLLIVLQSSSTVT
jgi:hypothetical protein